MKSDLIIQIIIVLLFLWLILLYFIKFGLLFGNLGLILIVIFLIFLGTNKK